MTGMQGIGKTLVGLGVVLVVIGLLVLAASRFTWVRAVFGQLGHLPGDIRYERGGFSFFAPITTCLLLSLLGWAALSLVALLRR